MGRRVPRDVLGGGLEGLADYGSVRRRVGRVAKLAHKGRNKLVEDVTVWYSQFLANGNTADGLEAHLAEAAATALPPRGDGLESLQAGDGRDARQRHGVSR